MLLSHGPHMFSILISNDVDHGDHHGSARLHWNLWANGFRTGIAIHLNQLELSFERMYIRYTSDTKVCRDVQSLHPHGQLELLFPYLDLKKTWAGYQKTQKDYVTIYIYIMMQESVFKSRNQTQPWLQPSNRSNRSYIDPSDSAAWRHHLSFDRLAEVGSQLNGPLNRPAQIRGIPWWKSSQNHHKWHVSRIGKEHPDGILDGILDGTMTSIWSKLIHKNSWFKVPHSFANCPAPKFWHRAAKVCWLCVQLVHQDISDLMGFTAVPARGPIRVTAVTVRSSEHWTSAISLVWKAPACFKTTQSLAKLASMPSDTMKSGNFMEFPYPEGHWLQFRRF